MNRLRRLATAVATTALALALAACSGLPTSGPVNAGQPIADDRGDSFPVFAPNGPAKDATPQQIVEGFIAAGSGPQGTWATARQFLAPGFDWNPRAGVTVYAPGDRDLVATGEHDFTLTVRPVATIDAAGELSAEAGEIPLSYSLAKQDDGQWRITDAPQGVVLDRNFFAIVYGAYSLQFFDPSWTYLVPDQRWFPRQYATTSIATALVNGGPSEWLQGAVATAFTDAARLATQAVPLQSGIASVALQDGARQLDQTVLDRMQTQLEASLKPAGVNAVDMMSAEQLLSATPVAVRETRVDSRPLVRTAEAFGFLSGTSVVTIPGLSEALLQIDAQDIEVSVDRTTAAVRNSAGAAMRVTTSGAAVLDARPGLLAPSIDPNGYIWTVPQDAPSAVRAFAAGAGNGIEIADAWPGAQQILSQRVSRDGTRIAAIVRGGDGYALWVAGILRNRDGAPTGFGTPKVLAQLPASASGLAWVDASTVAALTTQTGDPYLYTQSIGGFAETVRTPALVTTVAGGAQSGGLRVRDSTGELYSRGGANWQHVASGIVVLAQQQGTP
ncbi:MAG: hypothetical protein ABS63_01675 [Microbacterium sp. SCN 70-27]|uniref:LpqB family beta-propeller domain-containing protein n=1 Tax=unclassified Microbacterium TaxID=2609290 RepID=UPI0008684792|nr:MULTISPECIES: LpqB family beta-propeller domain-containing protein [unclassified Microbacterium]MBN9225360.1 hypothetical protein [Microbacterium sp.]ODT29001.1 MAG: hypothetical protein ABS63_01675 [Microbacterium sp. SCN 70-27]